MHSTKNSNCLEVVLNLARCMVLAAALPQFCRHEFGLPLEDRRHGLHGLLPNCLVEVHNHDDEGWVHPQNLVAHRTKGLIQVDAGVESIRENLPE